MSIGSGRKDYDRAQEDGDDEFLTYGRRDPPPNGRPQPLNVPPHVAEIPPLPPVLGFHITGDPALDERGIQEYITTNSSVSTRERQMVQDVLYLRRMAVASRQKYMDKALTTSKE